MDHVQQTENPQQKRVLVAAGIILVLAIVLAVIIVPGWRDAVRNFIFGDQRAELLRNVNKLGERIPEEERLNEEELILEVNTLSSTNLSAEESEAALEGLNQISR